MAGVDHCLALGNRPHQQLLALCVGHHGGGCAAPFAVGDRASVGDHRGSRFQPPKKLLTGNAGWQTLNASPMHRITEDEKLVFAGPSSLEKKRWNWQ